MKSKIIGGVRAPAGGRLIAGLSTVWLATILTSVSFAQELDATTSQPAEVEEESPPPPPPTPKVDVPLTLRGSVVVVTMAGATLEGRLVAISEDEIDIETYDRGRIIVDRSTILSVRELSERELRVTSSQSTFESSDATGRSTGLTKRWGIWGQFSGGPVWGDSKRVEPTGSFMFDVAGSFYFVYVGVGFGVTSFTGVSSFSQETTGGLRESGAPASGTFYIEAGLTQGLFIPYNLEGAIELRPAVGYGYQLMSSPTQNISDCIDCDSISYRYDGSGQYVRFQLGMYHSWHSPGSSRYGVFMAENGAFVGVTVSVQHFISAPLLRDALMFGFAFGLGP